MLNIVKSANECVNSIIFPGMTFKATYFPRLFNAEIARNARMIYIKQTIPFNIRSCCFTWDLPSSLPALIVWNEYVNTNIFIIYFHGNATDISQVYRFSQRQSRVFNAHFLAVEYPRYGFAGCNSNEDTINHCAKMDHKFVTEVLKVPSNRIIIFGNSIGTGPTCNLSSYLTEINQPPAAVILHSPFTQLNDVAEDILGCLKYCILNRWENWKLLIYSDEIDSQSIIQSPVLFIHADNDKIIDYEQSRILHETRLNQGLSSMIFTQQSNEDFNKGHNYFDYLTDLEIPILNFITNHVNHKSENSDINKNVDSNIHLNIFIDINIIDEYSLIPIEYQNIELETFTKYNCSLLTRWSLCPCMFCLELSCATTIQIINYLINNISFYQTPFQFQTKAKRGLDHLTTKKLLKRLYTTGNLVGLIEESSIVGKTKVKPKEAEIEKIELNKVINPLIATNTTDITKQNFSPIKINENKIISNNNNSIVKVMKKSDGYINVKSNENENEINDYNDVEL